MLLLFTDNAMKMETEAALKEIRDLLSYGDVEAAVSLLQENDIDLDYRDVTHDLQTLLMRICYCKLSYTDLEHVLAAIFDKAPDVNVQDSWGRTVLMHACIANKPILIEGLLDYEETDVTIADFDGNNALSYAVQNCDIHSMEDILSHRDGGLLVSKHNAKGTVYVYTFFMNMFVHMYVHVYCKSVIYLDSFLLNIYTRGL